MMAQAQQLRVAAVWGTTVVNLRLLRQGESYVVAAEDSIVPDGLGISAIPLRAVAGGWELDPRGSLSGLLKLRGRDEDPALLADTGASIPILPGDYGLLQFGLFSLFFQFASPGTPIGGTLAIEALVVLALISSGMVHFGVLAFLRLTSTPPPIPKPI